MRATSEMSYVSYTFILFVGVTAGIYYLAPQRWQWKVLLAASLLFYASFGLAFMPWLLGSSAVAWYGARWLEECRKKGGAAWKYGKLLAAVLVVCNLGVLFFLKWSGMGLALIHKIFGTGFAWKLVLPLGISFYTFQHTSYLMDVCWGRVQAEKNFFRYLLYAGYFPAIVSGPINRYARIGQHFFEGHVFCRDTFYRGLLRILWGYLKKMVIADRAAVFVDQVFDNYYMYRGLFILFAVLLFSVQLYMDFSGCMDIVLGVSLLFQIPMAENFRAPYGASSTAEFWRRWHMSLTSWFRDYLYIPLGGNRKGRVCRYLNIMVVFLFCGMWHGAGITFLVWGLLNGMYQIIGDATVNVRRKLCRSAGLYETGFGARLRKRMATTALVEFSWLFFRANGIREAFVMLRRMVTGWNPWILTDGTLYQAGLDIFDFLILLAGILLVGGVSHAAAKKDLHACFIRQSWLLQGVVILLALAVWYLFGIYGPGVTPEDFIYYNF